MSIPINWRLRTQRYSLQGNTCPKCGGHYFPPREVCPHCSALTEPFAIMMKGQPANEHARKLETAKAAV